MGWTNHKEDDGDSKFEQFLMKLCAYTNTGIHHDISKSEDYLASHEISDYIHKKKGLDITAVEKAFANEELSIRDVLEVGIHWANYQTHKNWHEVMDSVAEEFGVESPDLGDHGKGGAEVRVITDPNDLPDEVKEVLVDALSKMISKKKKGKK